MSGPYEPKARRSRKEWIVLIERQIASGKRPGRWALEQGLSPGALCWWRWRLGYSRRGQVLLKTGLVPRLVPVSVRREEPPAVLEVVLPGGAIVRVPRVFDRDQLSRVAAALGVAR
jgi:hypothetical protein